MMNGGNTMATQVFGKPSCINDYTFTYCPGCGHGVVNRLLGEAIDELGIIEDFIGCCYIGCAGMMTNFYDTDWMFPLHGRSPAVATGMKRVRPDAIIVGYQGDGDLAAIGTAEIVHAATRGENLTVIFVNNSNYGMTGGQMAPTTLIGQKTATTPMGRIAEYHGMPIRMSEMLAQLEGVCYAERVAVDTVANIRKTKKAIIKGIQNQIDKKGFSIIEVLSPCPVQWGLKPTDACKRITDVVTKTYPLKVFKDVDTTVSERAKEAFNG